MEFRIKKVLEEEGKGWKKGLRGVRIKKKKSKLDKRLLGIKKRIDKHLGY